MDVAPRGAQRPSCKSFYSKQMVKALCQKLCDSFSLVINTNTLASLIQLN